MNTIRDSIPVETLLRQYIDESTEYEVRREMPEEMKPKVDTCPVTEIPMPVKSPDKTPVIPVMTAPMQSVPMQSVPMQSIQSIPSISMNTNSNSTMSKSSISFNDDLETFEIPVDEETIHIGEDIPLNMLSFEDLEKSPVEIDLGIVEL
jgi:hypothetical protein